MPARLVRDNLVTVRVSRLRALGVIKHGMAEAAIAFGDLTVNLKLEHRVFPNGGGWSFFKCPCCDRRVRTLRRMPDDRIACKWCDGLRYACETGNKLPRIEALVQMLAHDKERPARLNRPGRALERRKRLEESLMRALIVERQEQLSGWPRPTKRTRT